MKGGLEPYFYVDELHSAIHNSMNNVARRKSNGSGIIRKNMYKAALGETGDLRSWRNARGLGQRYHGSYLNSCELPWYCFSYDKLYNIVSCRVRGVSFPTIFVVWVWVCIVRGCSLAASLPQTLLQQPAPLEVCVSNVCVVLLMVRVGVRSAGVKIEPGATGLGVERTCHG